MKFNDYDSIYFLGIGGIGMSALARWFKKKGMRIAGYDKTPTPLTHELIEEGMEIHFDDSVAFLPGYVSKEKTLVIFTPAIPKDHAEYNYLKDQGFTIVKRSEVLGMISKDYPTIGVAGTHGKTTTSTMVAHILHTAGSDMVAFLGGISSNYDSNLVMLGEVGPKTCVVAEADEFDRSFLRLFPDVAIVTSADPDHLDIYGDHSTMLDAYKQFITQVRPQGTIIVHEKVKSLAAGISRTVKTYGLSSGDYRADRLTARNGFFVFDIVGPDMRIDQVKLGVPGFHNAENAVAASVAAKTFGASDVAIRKALESFKGVKRRFEFVYQHDGIVYVDDYAHHPAEIEAFLRSLRAMYDKRKITAVFQPHLYTRTRDFSDGFATSLSIADEVVMMDIYPARELPIPGVTSDMVFRNVTSPSKIRCGKKDLMSKLEGIDVEVLATIGAGDIDTFVKPIKEMLKKKYEA